MGKIITPGDFPGRIDSTTDATVFSIQLMQGKKIDLRFEGSPEVIIQMLFDVMQANDTVAHTIITSVVIFADQKKIPMTEPGLKHHSFFNTALAGKIKL